MQGRDVAWARFHPKQRRKQVLVGLVVLALGWFVLECVSPSCDPLPVLQACPAAFPQHTLVTLCLGEKCAGDGNCRALQRWQSAGWAGEIVIVADHDIERCPGARVERMENSGTHYLWCDKIKALRSINGRALYIDTDIIPARCVAELGWSTRPQDVGMYADTLCAKCNQYNGGVIWTEHTPAAQVFLAEWEETCRTDPKSVRKTDAARNPRPDDQQALDVLLARDAEATNALARQPFIEMRYMSARIWAWLPGQKLWHYTHSVRAACGKQL
eukprot:TRINITY_DN21096_c0_g1_i1.p2 TRINITY_DN21096_c0_g1~~TRINITY_DN21096_c0_g1_i1.p2  ORF type:complete len:272 (+),score=65.49 TRINITY_DN21096_c0_g1_i1:84-899(+)